MKSFGNLTKRAIIQNKIINYTEKKTGDVLIINKQYINDIINDT